MWVLASSKPAATVSSLEAGCPPAIRSMALSVAPASTITMSTCPAALRLPATTKSNTHSSSSVKVGNGTHSPLRNPSRTAPSGPSKGMSLMERAAEAPFSEGTS